MSLKRIMAKAYKLQIQSLKVPPEVVKNSIKALEDLGKDPKSDSRTRSICHKFLVQHSLEVLKYENPPQI